MEFNDYLTLKFCPEVQDGALKKVELMSFHRISLYAEMVCARMPADRRTHAHARATHMRARARAQAQARTHIHMRARART